MFDLTHSSRRICGEEELSRDVRQGYPLGEKGLQFLSSGSSSGVNCAHRVFTRGLPSYLGPYLLPYASI